MDLSSRCRSSRCRTTDLGCRKTKVAPKAIWGVDTHVLSHENVALGYFWPIRGAAGNVTKVPVLGQPIERRLWACTLRLEAPGAEQFTTCDGCRHLRLPLSWS